MRPAGLVTTTWGSPQDAALELPFKTVHHRDDHHQGGDPDGDAKSGKQEINETKRLLRREPA